MLSGCPRSSFLSSQPIVPPLTCRSIFVGPGATFCDAGKPPLIHTVRGVGYTLRLPRG